MIDFDDDLTEMLDADDFGVTFTHNSDVVEAILTEEYFDAQVGRAGVEGWQPVLYIKESVVVGYDDVLTIEGDQYKVINIEPTRTGVKMVMLHAL